MYFLVFVLYVCPFQSSDQSESNLRDSPLGSRDSAVLIPTQNNLFRLVTSTTRFVAPVLTSLTFFFLFSASFFSIFSYFFLLVLFANCSERSEQKCIKHNSPWGVLPFIMRFCIFDHMRIKNTLSARHARPSIFSSVCPFVRPFVRISVPDNH